MTTQDYFEHSTAFWQSFSMAPIKHPGEAEVFHALLYFATIKGDDPLEISSSEIAHRTGQNYHIIDNCMRWFSRHQYLYYAADLNEIDSKYIVFFTLIPVGHEL